uniref:PDZ and LIM domain 5b n=1 Tax=Nothobranchius pienaari TaxID=704102 RepID=A0A1A8LP08_9TELE
MQTSPFASL